MLHEEQMACIAEIYGFMESSNEGLADMLGWRLTRSYMKEKLRRDASYETLAGSMCVHNLHNFGDSSHPSNELRVDVIAARNKTLLEKNGCNRSTKMHKLHQSTARCKIFVSNKEKEK